VRTAANVGAREAAARKHRRHRRSRCPVLLDELDGEVTQPKGLALHTAGAEVDRVEMSFWKRALDLLIDPNIIALMLSLGVVGILVELWHPGLIFPGTVGGISLVVGLYGLQVLPVSVAGALLRCSRPGSSQPTSSSRRTGALTLAGAVTFVIGALMLFDPAGPAYQVSLWTALADRGDARRAARHSPQPRVRARRNPVEVGIGNLVGWEGEVRRDGFVQVAGECGGHAAREGHSSCRATTSRSRLLRTTSGSS